MSGECCHCGEHVADCICRQIDDAAHKALRETTETVEILDEKFECRWADYRDFCSRWPAVRCANYTFHQAWLMGFRAAQGMETRRAETTGSVAKP